MARVAGLLIVAGLAVLTACGKPSATGKWTGSNSIGLSSATVDLDLKSDKSFTMSIDETVIGEAHKIVGSGTWAAEEPKGDLQSLQLTGTKGTLDGKPAPSPKDVIKATYDWKNDTLRLDLGESTLGLTRAKEGN